MRLLSRRSELGARRRSCATRAVELAGIRIARADVAPLAAFLRALNEDYN